MSAQNSLADGRDIAVPVAGKRPVRINVFDFARSTGSSLVPLFPYLGDGDIVPCLSVYRGGAEASVFQHTNSVEEIYMWFGARGGPIRPGQVRVGEREHPVGAFLPKDPNAYSLVVITHREAEAGVPQEEVFTVVCEKCSTPLVVHPFDAKAHDREGMAIPDGYAVPIPTIMGTYAGVQKLNESEESRTCKNCGHVRDTFVVSAYHWDVYAEHSWCADQSIQAFLNESGPR